jgi:hypothetical protein
MPNIELDESAVKATETKETEVKTAEEKTDDSASAPTEEKKETTKETDEAPKTVKEATEEYLDDIQPLENDERGKFFLKVGDSTYYGETQKEVIKNLIRGKVESDTYIKKVKASEKVKVPASIKEESFTDVELPNEDELFDKHITVLTKKNGIESAMLRYGREDWNKYQDDNQLRDYEIAELRQTVRETINKANELTASDMRVANVAFVNNHILDEETQAVREMLVVSGIDQEKFDYEKVLEVAIKKRDKNGILSSGAVTAEATKEIIRIMKQSTPVKKDLDAVIKKGKETKEKVATPPAADKLNTKKDDGKSLSYEEIAREVKKSLGRSGRDI